MIGWPVRYFLLLFALAVPSSVLGGKNYCDSTHKKICENKGEHVGCHPKDFSQYHTCHNLHPKMIPITKSYKSYILKRHNQLRNTLAGGKLSSPNGAFPSAAGMPVLQWDDELAKLAEWNVKQCEMEHDRCRSTTKFKDAGQNIYYSSWSVKRKNKKKLIGEAIQAWWDEYKDFYVHEVEKYEGQSGGVLHFTAMGVDYQTHVGCAISEYDYAGTGDTFLMTCNYSSWTWMGQAIYKSGQPCSKCKSKKCDKKYTSLCSAR